MSSTEVERLRRQLAAAWLTLELSPHVDGDWAALAGERNCDRVEWKDDAPDPASVTKVAKDILKNVDEKWLKNSGNGATGFHDALRRRVAAERERASREQEQRIKDLDRKFFGGG